MKEDTGSRKGQRTGHLHAVKSACTVGKTFVADCIKANQYALACLRKEIRNQRPRAVPVNAVWAMDLTFYSDASGRQQMALGILDHGSRLVTCLHTLVNKRSWQNGRVERFFGTLKKCLRQLQFKGRRSLDFSMAEFAHWYNAIRPHQNLGGLTPLEAWHGIEPFHMPKEIAFVQAWDGLLCGFHIRR